MQTIDKSKRINSFSIDNIKQISLCSASYEYQLINLEYQENYKTENLKSFIVYCISGKIGIEEYVLEADDAIQIELKDIEISSIDKSIFIIVGTNRSFVTKSSIQTISTGMIKRIEKVWGYENWIGGNDSDYFLKKIFLKKDNQSSLQYHSRKEETILLYNGNAELTYKTDKMKNLTSENLSKTNLYPCTVIHNKPYEIHRIKAHTDIILFEASTPDLDDVVRIQI